MKWVPIYFTENQWDSWMSGNLAIAFTQDERDKMRECEKVGLSFDLKSDPLNHMTKVHPLSLRKVRTSLFGVYTSRSRN